MENTRIENVLEYLNSQRFVRDLSFPGKPYLVGGLVRDSITGNENKDIDMLITKRPLLEIEEILIKYGSVSRTTVGDTFGCLKFRPEGWKAEPIDIAIPRTERKVSQGHTGFEINSDHNLPLEKDLERRDFTMNAMAIDMDGNFIDLFGGTQDIQNKIIRAVNPEVFVDDPLRMLRAIQFSSRLNFNYDEKTYKMILDNSHLIREIKAERIFEELEKVFNKGNKAKCLKDMMQSGLYSELFDIKIVPNFDEYLIQDFEKGTSLADFYYLLLKYSPKKPSHTYRKILKGDSKTYRAIAALEYAKEECAKKFDKTDSPFYRKIAFNMYHKSIDSFECSILPAEVMFAVNELKGGKYPKTVNEININGIEIMETIKIDIRLIGKLKLHILNKLFRGELNNIKEELLAYIQTIDLEILTDEN